VPAGVRISSSFPLTRPKPPAVLPLQRAEELTRRHDPDDPFADDSDSTVASATAPSPRGSDGGAGEVQRPLWSPSPLAIARCRGWSCSSSSRAHTLTCAVWRCVWVQRGETAGGRGEREEREEQHAATLTAERHAETQRRERVERQAAAGVRNAYYSSDASLVVPPEVIDGVWLKPDPGALSALLVTLGVGGWAR
jgi:hypothetical protein